MTRRRLDTLVVVTLLLATAAVYWPVRHFGLLAFDDDLYLADNPHVDAGLTPAGVRWAFTTVRAANYAPLVWVSYMLDRSVLGGRPPAMHVENVAIHAANAVLLFALMVRLTGDRWPAAFAAAAFAVHPAHVESVAWVAERKDVLSTAFLLLSAHAYVTYARTGSGPAYALVAAAFAASLLAKAMGVTFPAVLLLLDAWPLRRTRWRRLAWEKVPLLPLSVAAAVLTTVAQRRAGAVAALDAVTPAARLGNAVVAYVRYLGESIWPYDLAAYYPFRWPLPAAVVVGSGAALIALTVAAIRLRRPPVLVGWLWFLGTLVPVIGLLQVGSQAMADRYLYVPMIGLTLAVWAVKPTGRWRPAVGGIAIAALVALGFAARRQVWFWADTATLKDRILAVTGGAAQLDDKLGVDAAAAGDAAGAERLFAEAVTIDPADATALFDLGNLRLRSEHQPAAAAECYRRAAAVRPDVAVVECNWGVALLQLGRPADAFEHLRAAERIDPDLFDPHFNLGLLLRSAGRRDAAAAEFAAAVRSDPTSAAARERLAESLGH